MSKEETTTNILGENKGWTRLSTRSAQKSMQKEFAFDAFKENTIDLLLSSSCEVLRPVSD